MPRQGWLLTDPATLLHTGGFGEDVPPRMLTELIDDELTGDDFAKFSTIARSARPALALSEATGGELARSARHRALYAPAGYGDELRAAFRTGAACWGVACLARTVEQPPFSAAEVAFLAGVGEHVAHGLRSGLLLDALHAPEPPGMIVLGHDGALEALSGEAERWLAELPSDGLELPLVVYEVARQGGPGTRRRLARESRWRRAAG